MSASKIVWKIVSISASILVMVLLVVLLYQCGRKAYAFGYRVFTEPAIDAEEEGKDKVVQISSDMGAAEIGILLEKKGLIRDANLFVVQLKLSACSKTIKAGTYTLSTAMTAQEMMHVMSAEDEQDTEEQSD